MVADDIRRAINTASRLTLPAVTALLWRAFGEEKITEAEAEALSALIELRRASSRSGEKLSAPSGSEPAEPLAYGHAFQGRQNSPRTGVGSRPRTNASLERRRRWAASGRLPPALAARFTLAEQAVLSLVAAETARRGDCRLTVGHVASMAGVAETTVRNAIREARKLGLLSVEERRITGFRNDTNVVRVISPEWTAWLRLARKETRLTSVHRGGGCKSPNRTPTQVLEQGKTRTTRAAKGRSANPDRGSRGSLRVVGA